MAATDFDLWKFQTTSKLDRLADVIDGNPTRDIKGVRPRVDTIEEVLKELAERNRIADEREQTKAAWRKGATVAFGAQTGLMTILIALVIELLKQVATKH